MIWVGLGLSVLGAQVRVTGGDTPAYGVAAGLSNPS
jgi:hypothetical protein